MSETLERLDRRAFLSGLMLTSAGLLVPKPVQVFVPRSNSLYLAYYEASGDFYLSVVTDIHTVNRKHFEEEVSYTKYARSIDG